MRISKHYFAAVSAFIIWGFFSLVLKPLQDYPSLDILFYRVFLCVILMLGINLLFRRNILKETKQNFTEMLPKQKRNAILLTLGGAILLTANWFFFIYVMNHVGVKTAAFAYLVCPILTMVFAYFIIQEKLNKWQWTAVGISVFSCILLGYNHLMDIFYSIIIAATYALYLVSQRKNTAIDKFLLLTLQLTTSAIILLPFYPFYRGEVPTEFSFYFYIAIISVFFTIIPLFLNLFALKKMNSATVGILLYINPLINFFLAIFYYKEEITAIQIVAYSLIFLSIIIFNMRTIFKPKTAVLPQN
ncbi:EamA family transporter [uncultured Flavobacterium sp.]|uniref:EamA family transporter n=1 Tax=uncultured Flavobacterium sp. TaxID=165435 RepID=UPI0025CBF3B4|nr:EamA family transporter [uncultured Flavobacterium sp.]